jgi:hypothetical protein
LLIKFLRKFFRSDNKGSLQVKDANGRITVSGLSNGDLHADNHDSSRVREMIAIGEAAESAVDHYFKSWKWTSLLCKLPGGRGFDHVFIRSFPFAHYEHRWSAPHRHILIVETKANGAKLLGDQMTDDWINRKIQQMMNCIQIPELQSTAGIISDALSGKPDLSISNHLVRVKVKRSLDKPFFEASIEGLRLITPAAKIQMDSELVRVMTKWSEWPDDTQDEIADDPWEDWEEKFWQKEDELAEQQRKEAEELEEYRALQAWESHQQHCREIPMGHDINDF